MRDSDCWARAWGCGMPWDWAVKGWVMVGWEIALGWALDWAKALGWIPPLRKVTSMRLLPDDGPEPSPRTTACRPLCGHPAPGTVPDLRHVSASGKAAGSDGGGTGRPLATPSWP